MAIHEKNKILEFSYENDNISSGESDGRMDYDIIYDPSISDIPLKIMSLRENREISCPTNLLVEIVQFLISKNIIDSNKLADIFGIKSASNFIGAGSFSEYLLAKAKSEAKKDSILNEKNIKTVLPLPLIQKKEQTDIMPITSFDVETVPQSLPNAQTLSDDSDDSLISVEKGPEQSKTVSVSKVTPEDEKLMKSRMVIKSRVSDPEEDPMGAEKEGAMLRESINKGKKPRKIRKLD